MTKRCSRCEKDKPFEDYHKASKMKDGRASWCKPCDKIRCHERYERHKKVIDARNRSWEKNNPEKMAEYGRRRRARHPDRIREKNRRWLASNREQRNEWQREYIREKRKTDPNYVLAQTNRTRIRMALIGQKKCKRSKELLGTTVDEYRIYLESLFTPDMNWGNYGTHWVIDHIKPCCSFDFSKPENQLACFHYKNTRPLTRFQNGSKIVSDKALRLQKTEDSALTPHESGVTTPTS